jgi:hypothetical protein
VAEAVQERVVQAATAPEEPPGVAVLIHEGEHPVDQRRQPAPGGGGPLQAVADPVIEAPDDPDLNGVEEAAAITEVGVEQRAGRACGPGDVLQRGAERVVLGQQRFGRVEDEGPADVRGEASRPAQEAAPATVTWVSASPGSSGWWQATN